MLLASRKGQNRVWDNILKMSGANDVPNNGQAVDHQRHVRNIHGSLGNGQGNDVSALRHDVEVEAPVRENAGSNEQPVDLVRNLKVGDTLGGVELVSAEFQRLGLLRVRARKHNNRAAHLGGELDGKMPESSNSDNSDSVGGIAAGLMKRRVDGGASAHQRCGIGGREPSGNGEAVGLPPDCMGGEGTLVGVGVAEHLGSVAVGLVSGETLRAHSASLVLRISFYYIGNGVDSRQTLWMYPQPITSPFLNLVQAEPSSSTMPTPSCPRAMPACL
jgi:hypothetical protein